MPYDFDADLCRRCPFGRCFEDRRDNPVPGRKTQFRVRQQIALSCTFEDFVPGSGKGTLSNLGFDEYLKRFRSNVEQAGSTLIGQDFFIDSNALRKVEGDVFELLIAAVLWNVAVGWNLYMESGQWVSSLQYPDGTVAHPLNKFAIVKLPRGYDATKLLTPAAGQEIDAMKQFLREHNMMLDLSSPDILGVRIPEPLPGPGELFSELSDYSLFSIPFENFSEDNYRLIEMAYKNLEGKLTGRDFLFALAIKHTMRSDRLYQPLFEANVLKYLIQGILREASFKFYVYAESVEGADVVGRYKAASLVSLIQGGKPQLAIDRLLISTKPLELAQLVLNDISSYFQARD